MKTLPYIGIIVLLLIVLLQNKGCNNQNGQDNTPKIDTVYKTIHITDTVIIEKPVLVAAIPDTVWMKEEENTPDSTYDGLLNQYTELGNRYFTTNVFQNKFEIEDYGSVTVTDSIYGNWLMNSTMFTDLKIPTTTITIEKEAPKKNEFYFGPQLSMSRTYPISGVYGSALLKTKQDKIYHLSLGYNGEAQIMGGLYFKIKIK